jgi:hypothetical protein
MRRQVWGIDELVTLAAALALGMSDEQRQGLARLLLGIGAPVADIAKAMGMREPEYRGGTLGGDLARRG